MGGRRATETQRHRFGSDHPVGIFALVRIGAARHYPPCQTGFFTARAKNQKPPLGKKPCTARVCEPIGKFSDRERGGVFALRCRKRQRVSLAEPAVG